MQFIKAIFGKEKNEDRSVYKRKYCILHLKWTHMPLWWVSHIFNCFFQYFLYTVNPITKSRQEDLAQ